MIWRCGARAEGIKRGEEGRERPVKGTRSFTITSLCSSLKMSADCEKEWVSSACLVDRKRLSSTLHLPSILTPSSDRVCSDTTSSCDTDAFMELTSMSSCSAHSTATSSYAGRGGRICMSQSTTGVGCMGFGRARLGLCGGTISKMEAA